MTHVVQFSGGVASYCAAKRVVEQYGPAQTKLLFCDTKTEDEDLYRFLEQAQLVLDAELVQLQDGRDVWELFHDRRMIGNTRMDLCSETLKRNLADRWIKANFTSETVTCYVGMDWTEVNRFERMAARKLPWQYKAPLFGEPLLNKEQMLEIAKADGIRPPRLYELGFPHNNCGGFCVKAGVAHFVHLLRTMPVRYMYHEQKEQELRDYLGKDVAILRDRTGGTTKPLTLKSLRERILAGEEGQLDMFDWGGCGCFAA